MSDRSILISGATAGGAVAVITAWRVDRDVLHETFQRLHDVQADARGTAEIRLHAPVPEGAFIAVIDLASGRQVATPDDRTTLARVDLPRRLKRNTEGEVAQIAAPHTVAMFLVVRPGEGAWTALVGDGMAGDADGRTDGRVTLDPGTMTPVWQSAPAPKKLKNRDLVFLTDARSGLFGTTEVKP